MNTSIQKVKKAISKVMEVPMTSITILDSLQDLEDKSMEKYIYTITFGKYICKGFEVTIDVAMGILIPLNIHPNVKYDNKKQSIQ
jgi:hypothetical protein